MSAPSLKPACRPRVEKVDTGEWEAWCPAHPLANGDTGLIRFTWTGALAAVRHLPCQHSNRSAEA